MAPAVALEHGVHDVDGPAADLLRHAPEDGDDVGAPALEVLMDVVARGLTCPGRAVGEGSEPDGDVVSGYGGRDVNLLVRKGGLVSIRSRG